MGRAEAGDDQEAPKKEELPIKADAIDVEKLRMAQEQVMKDLEAMASQAMTPEMEAALAELVQIPEIKKMLGEQGRQLAELFTSKIGGDDLAKVTDDLAKADERLEQQLESHVQELALNFQEARDQTAERLGELDDTVQAKADLEWMQALEKEIVGEVERLRLAGLSNITKEELEKKLAALRRKIANASGMTEVGSAAFRCIACNRPLPDMSQWKIDQATTHETTVRPTRPKFGKGRSELAGLPQHEIVLRGGFPMVNPKVKQKVFPRRQALDPIESCVLTALLLGDDRTGR